MCTIAAGFRRSMVIVITIATPVVLSACGPIYDYTPPESPEGRVCAAQCVNTKSYCEQAEHSRYQQCQANYNLGQQNYQSCKAAGGTFCSSPSICLGPNTYRCDENYRACFSACGGKITARPTKSG